MPSRFPFGKPLSGYPTAPTMHLANTLSSDKNNKEREEPLLEAGVFLDLVGKVDLTYEHPAAAVTLNAKAVENFCSWPSLLHCLYVLFVLVSNWFSAGEAPDWHEHFFKSPLKLFDLSVRLGKPCACLGTLELLGLDTTGVFNQEALVNIKHPSL